MVSQLLQPPTLDTESKVIVSRTPYRISFFGGGTDYPGWYRENGGEVLNATINKYCYINTRYLPPFFKYKYLIRYFRREEVHSIKEIKHPSVRECFNFMTVDRGVEIVHTGDIPALSGVGSSSAFTVGLLNTLHALSGQMVGKKQLARDAMDIEQNWIKENVGSQDQVATAFGGLNHVEFNGEEEFLVHPITIGQEKLRCFQNHLMLFFTGFARYASEIAREQIGRIKKNKSSLREMQGMVGEAIKILNGPKERITEFGELMHDSWMKKRSLSSRISNDAIDYMYSKACKSGAIGGKLCGAGGGGFMLLFVPPEDHFHVNQALSDYLHVPFSFENQGSQITMYSPPEIY